jgi:hypothetical protein
LPRDIPVGNGALLVAFDKDALLRELYFPHVGEERHVAGRPFRLGVWVEGLLRLGAPGLEDRPGLP